MAQVGGEADSLENLDAVSPEGSSTEEKLPDS
jgi:hypothetical protein